MDDTELPMDPIPQHFTLHAYLLGVRQECSFWDSIAAAEAHFGELVTAGHADCGEIYALRRPGGPVRLLQLRQ